MRKSLFIITAFLWAFSTLYAKVTKQSVKASYGVIERVTGKSDIPVKFKIKERKGDDGSLTYFNYSVDNGVLNITGSSPAAICRGFYDYVKSNNLGIYSWSGSNISFPDELYEKSEKEVVSPFRHHYIFNVCTFGYTMPYWDWDRWEKEIDWMALHGIDMPLAQVAYEAIIARVWKKFGLTDDEINNYFVGPAHLPWMRMGNMTGVDGPLNADWHRQQIELQHKILDRMTSLGMKPICPGFAGFIPEAFKRVYPDLNIVKTHWAKVFHNFMISPEEELFGKIETEFIREWEKEFGKCEYYLIDSFNEMEIPFPPKGSKERYELLTNYGDKVYQAVKQANPDAVWVMQGWMFGYARDIWDYETLEALLKKIPDDKMLIVDLGVDYNKFFWRSTVSWEYYKGLFNKRWIYSVIPNMGGRTGMNGYLDFYANGHLEALNSPYKGRLEAHGTAPEGIENNEVIFELIADAGWSDTKIDVDKWLENYSLNRYGAFTPGIKKYWELIQKSVYGAFPGQHYNWQFRPGRVYRGSVKINDNFFKAIESFISDAKKMNDKPLYKVDLSELLGLYIGGKLEYLVRAIDYQYNIGDTLRAIKLQNDFEFLMKAMDKSLCCHPNLRLEKWVDSAKKYACNDEQRRQYEIDAKRIVTIWGPITCPPQDYSARVWSGLIRDYYLPRWKNYFYSRKTGEKFNFPEWEEKWVTTSEGYSTPVLPDNLMNFAQSMIDYTAFITDDIVPKTSSEKIGEWNLDMNTKGTFKFSVNPTILNNIKALQVRCNSADFYISSISVIADGDVVFSKKDISDNQKNGFVSCPVSLPSVVRANNGLEICIEILNNDSKAVSGSVSLFTASE